MWQKIKCKLGFHEWRHWENVKKVHSSGFVFYEVTGSGTKCKHCGKRLGSRIVQAGYSAKELGLTRIKR